MLKIFSLRRNRTTYKLTIPLITYTVSQTQNNNVAKQKSKVVDCLCPELQVTNAEQTDTSTNPKGETCTLIAQEQLSRYLLYCKRNAELRQNTVSSISLRKYLTVDGSCEGKFLADCYAECDIPLNKCTSFKEEFERLSTFWNELRTKCGLDQDFLDVGPRRRSRSADPDNSVSEVSKPSFSVTTVVPTAARVVSGPKARLMGRTLSQREQKPHRYYDDYTMGGRSPASGRSHSLPPRVSRSIYPPASYHKREIPTLIYHPIPMRRPEDRLAGTYEVFYPSSSSAAGICHAPVARLPRYRLTTQTGSSGQIIRRGHSVSSLIGTPRKAVSRGASTPTSRVTGTSSRRSSDVQSKPMSRKNIGAKASATPKKAVSTKSSKLSTKTSTKRTFVPPLIHQSIPSMKVSTEEECSELIQHATAAILSSPAIYFWGSVFLPKDSIFPKIAEPPTQMLSNLSQSTIPDGDDDDDDYDGNNGPDVEQAGSSGRNLYKDGPRGTRDPGTNQGGPDIPEDRDRSSHERPRMDDTVHSSDLSKGGSPKESESPTQELRSKETSTAQPVHIPLKDGPEECANICMLGYPIESSGGSPPKSPVVMERAVFNEEPPIQSDHVESITSQYTSDEYHSTTIPPTEIMDSTWKPTTTASKSSSSSSKSRDGTKPENYRYMNIRDVEEDEEAFSTYPGIPSADAHRAQGASSPNLDDDIIPPSSKRKLTPAELTALRLPQINTRESMTRPRTTESTSDSIAKSPGKNLDDAGIPSPPIQLEQAEMLSDSISNSTDDMGSTTIPPTEKGENTVTMKVSETGLPTNLDPSSTVPTLRQPWYHARNVEEEEESTNGKYPGTPSANTHRVQGTSSPTRMNQASRQPAGFNVPKTNLSAVEYSAHSEEPTDTLPWNRSVFSSHDVFLVSNAAKQIGPEMDAFQRDSDSNKSPGDQASLKKQWRPAGIRSRQSSKQSRESHPRQSIGKLVKSRTPRSSASTVQHSPSERQSIKSFTLTRQGETLSARKYSTNEQDSHSKTSLYSLRRSSRERSLKKSDLKSGESPLKPDQRRRSVARLSIASERSSGQTDSDKTRKTTTTNTTSSDRLFTGDDQRSIKRRIEKVHMTTKTSTIEYLEQSSDESISEEFQSTMKASILKEVVEIDEVELSGSGHRSPDSNGSHVSKFDRKALELLEDADDGEDEIRTEESTKVTGVQFTDWEESSLLEVTREPQRTKGRVPRKNPHQQFSRNATELFREHIVDLNEQSNHESAKLVKLGSLPVRPTDDESTIRSVQPKSQLVHSSDGDQDLKRRDHFPREGCVIGPMTSSLDKTIEQQRVMSPEQCQCTRKAGNPDQMIDITLKTMTSYRPIKHPAKQVVPRDLNVKPGGEVMDRSKRPPLHVPERRLKEIKRRNTTSTESGVLRSLSKGNLVKNVANVKAVKSLMTGDAGKLERPSIQSPEIRMLNRRSRTAESAPCSSINSLKYEVSKFHQNDGEISAKMQCPGHLARLPKRSRSCVFSRSPYIIRSMSSEFSCFPAAMYAINPCDHAVCIPYIDSIFSSPAKLNEPGKTSECDCSPRQQIIAALRRSASQHKQHTSSEGERGIPCASCCRAPCLPQRSFLSASCTCADEDERTPCSSCPDESSYIDRTYGLDGCLEQGTPSCRCHPCVQQDVYVITTPGACAPGQPMCCCGLCASEKLQRLNSRPLHAANCTCGHGCEHTCVSSSGSSIFADSDGGVDQCAITNNSGSNAYTLFEFETPHELKQHTVAEPLKNPSRCSPIKPSEPLFGSPPQSRVMRKRISRLESEERFDPPQSKQGIYPNRRTKNDKMTDRNDFTHRLRRVCLLTVQAEKKLDLLRKVIPDATGKCLMGQDKCRVTSRSENAGDDPKTFKEMTRSVIPFKLNPESEKKRLSSNRIIPQNINNGDSHRSALPCQTDFDTRVSDEYRKLQPSRISSEKDSCSRKFPKPSKFSRSVSHNQALKVRKLSISSEKITPEAQQTLNAIRDTLLLLTQDLIALEDQILSHNFRLCEAIAEHLALLPQMCSTLLEQLQYSPEEGDLVRSLGALEELVKKVVEDPVSVLFQLLELAYRLNEWSSMLGGTLIPAEFTKLIHSIQVKLLRLKVGYVARQYFQIPQTDDDLITHGGKSRWLLHLEAMCGCKVNLLNPQDSRIMYCPQKYRTIEVLYDEQRGKPHLFQSRLESAIDPLRRSVRSIAIIVKQIDGQEYNMQPESVREFLHCSVRPRYSDVRALVMPTAKF